MLHLGNLKVSLHKPVKPGQENLRSMNRSPFFFLFLFFLLWFGHLSFKLQFVVETIDQLWSDAVVCGVVHDLVVAMFYRSYMFDY